MVDIILLLIGTAFFTFLAAGFMFVIFKKKLMMNQRMYQYFGEKASVKKESKNDSSKLEQTKVTHFFQLYWDKGTDYLSKKVSKTERKKIDDMLRDAGHPFKSALDFRLFQFVLSLCLSVPIIIFLLPISDSESSTWLLALALGMLGFRYPIFYLGKKKTARVKEINKSMPDFFDTINILLEAGMGVDQAITEVSRKLKGPLSEEFFQTLEDMKLGKSRREAFYALRKRVPSDSFQSVITSLIQADQLGIGMAKVLGNITIRIREQRREAAREQAMKAPVKMLFPMVIFIFPALFIVILGPMAIKLITEGFGG